MWPRRSREDSGGARSRATAAVAIATVTLATAVVLVGCGDHPQSAIHPRASEARSIAWIWWVMFAVLTAVTIATFVIAAMAIWRGGSEDSAKPASGPLGDKFILLAGAIIPAVILVALLFYAMTLQVTLKPPADALRVRIIGHQFWWEVRYPDLDLITANELYLPVGRAVRVELASNDVIHSFWVPNLHGKMDTIPEIDNVFWLRADRAGSYRGQCAEFCGVQHAWMALTVDALPPEEFEAWVQRKRRPTPQTGTAVLQRGEQVFARACAHCHAVRDTRFVGRIGPDLTHVATRPTLGSGLLPNTPENLGRWILQPQKLKPGNRMPDTPLPQDDLDALVQYLGTLE